MAKAKDKREKRKKKYTTTKRVLERENESRGSSVVKTPQGMSNFKFQLDGDKKKKYLLDIIPYTAKKGNPRADEGETHWERKYWVHKGVGPQDKWYVCASSTWGEEHRCPICEYASKLRKEGKADKDALKEFKPKERQLFYVIDTNDKEKGVQLFDTYGYMRDDTAFGQLILGKLESVDDEPDHKYHNFFHPENGMSVKVMSKKHTMPDASFVSNGSSIDFVDRKKQYKEDQFDDLPSLDDLIIEPDYDKMKKAFLEGGVEDDEDEDTENQVAKKGNKKKKKKEEDDGDEDEDEEDEESEESGDEDEDEDSDDSDDDEESDDEEEEDEEGDDDEEEEEEDEPVKKKKKKDKEKPKKKKKKKEEDDDEDEDDDDESPLEGEDDDDEEEDDDEESEDEDDEEEEEKPKKKKKEVKETKKSKKKKKVKDDDEEVEEEEEESSEDEESEEEDDDEDAPWDDDDGDEDSDDDEEDE